MKFVITPKTNNQQVTSYVVTWPAAGHVQKPNLIWNLLVIVFDEMKLKEAVFEIVAPNDTVAYTHIHATTYYQYSFDSVQYQLKFRVIGIKFETEEHAKQFIDILDKRVLMLMLKKDYNS